MTQAIPAWTNPLIRYIDIFPASITPMPSDVPSVRKLRVIVTDQYLTIGWDGPGGAPMRKDIALEPGDVNDEVTYAGGTVRGYEIARKGQCGTCGGGAKIRSWTPFPGAQFIEEPRKETLAKQITGSKKVQTGLIPVRYERAR